MDFAVLTGLVVAIMACVGVWFQARSVRVSEAQLKSQVESMQAVLDKLEVERREREAAVAQVDAQIGVIDSDIHDSHRRNWDHATNAATLQSLHTSKLAMVTALLAHTASLFEAADLQMRERFEVAADYALAISASTELDSNFLLEMTKWRDLNRSGQTTETPEEVSARFDAERRRVSEQHSTASDRFAKVFRGGGGGSVPPPNGG